jgi:hypothetical protein
MGSLWRAPRLFAKRRFRSASVHIRASTSTPFCITTMLWGAEPMRIIVSVVAIAAMFGSSAMAQSTTPRAPAAVATSAEIEEGISEAARSLESLSRIMAIMGPGLSKAMQAASPGIGRAVGAAQPSLNRAMATAAPQMEAMGSRMAASAPRSANAGPPTGADMARTMQSAASSLESLSRMMGSVAPDFGKAYDAAAPELRGALAQARPALEEAIKAAEPELRRMAPTSVTPPPAQERISDDDI